MRILLLTILLFTFFIPVKSQEQINKDSLTREICQTIKTETFSSDSAAVINGMVKHLVTFLNQLDPDAQLELVESFYIRLQKECIEFALLTDKLQKGNSDWQRIYHEPGSKASIDDCKDFFQKQTFKYLERNGDTTVVIITDSTWTDYFIDSTYSKLSLTNHADCSFAIKFIESNNILRKNFSKQGDVYRYKILEKKEKYFIIYVELQDKSQMATTKFYY